MGSVIGVPVTVKEFCVAGICLEDQDVVMVTWQFWRFLWSIQSYNMSFSLKELWEGTRLVS